MMALTEWMLSADLGRQKLSLLALCVVAMYVLGSRLQWQLTRLETGWWLKLRIGQSKLGRAALQTARLIYYVGIPAAMLWRLGLQELAQPTGGLRDWGVKALFPLSGVGTPSGIVGLGAALAISGGSLYLMMAVWVWHAHVGLCRPSPGPRIQLRPLAWWLAVREAVFFQVFWLFCRGIARTWTADRVWVAFASVALIAAMWVLSPLRSARLRDPFWAHAEVQEWMVAMWTGAIYLVTDLFWSQVLWHALWLWLGGRALSYLSRANPPAPLAGADASG